MPFGIELAQSLVFRRVQYHHIVTASRRDCHRPALGHRQRIAEAPLKIG